MLKLCFFEKAEGGRNDIGKNYRVEHNGMIYFDERKYGTFFPLNSTCVRTNGTFFRHRRWKELSIQEMGQLFGFKTYLHRQGKFVRTYLRARKS